MTILASRLIKLMFLLSACLLPTLAIAQENTAPISQISWFNLKPNAAQNWEILPHPDDEFQFTLKTKHPEDFLDETNPKKVLILFPKKSSAYDTGVARILRVFDSKRVYATFTAINFNKNPELGKKALHFAEINNFDLIISMGSISTAFVHENYSMGVLPVVSALSKDPVLLGQMPDYDSGSGSNIAYTSVSVPIELQVSYLKKLKPNLQNIGILYDANNTSAVKSQVKPLKEIAAQYNIHVIDVAIDPTNTLEAVKELETQIPIAIAEIKKADPEVRNSIFWITGSTTVFDNRTTINRVAENVPVLSFSTAHVSGGDDSVLLSVGASFENNAHIAALYAIDILNGRKQAGELPVGVVKPPDIAINFKMARKIQMKIPFSFFETASFVYDHTGKLVRKDGQIVAR